MMQSEWFLNISSYLLFGFVFNMSLWNSFDVLKKIVPTIFNLQCHHMFMSVNLSIRQSR